MVFSKCSHLPYIIHTVYIISFISIYYDRVMRIVAALVPRSHESIQST